MRQFLRTSTQLLFFVFFVSKIIAQPVYTGSRVALFEVQILQQKNQNLQLRCRMANTGRETIGGKKSSPDMVVEFDTIGLPVLLRGHESSIATAVRGNCPKLKPGEVSAAIWLNVAFQPRLWEGQEGCARIIFDTVFVGVWNERNMRLRYVLKNTGNAAANLFSAQSEPLLNIYFVRDEKLTRGAIPAGSTNLQKGRETLDGMLFPGQFLEGTVEISLKDRTRFSPNIAVEFDPAQTLERCGQSRNVWILRLRF
jgi:hypothetical protein